MRARLKKKAGGRGGRSPPRGVVIRTWVELGFEPVIIEIIIIIVLLLVVIAIIFIIKMIML